MRTVLIFGIGGFVGHYLAEEFHGNGYQVAGADLKKTETLPGYIDFQNIDILDAEMVAEFVQRVRPTHIVNLAAISSVGLSWKIPQKTIAVNVEGTLNILEAARCCEKKPRVLLIGSSEEYAISKEPIHEDSPINANNPYGISKMMQEKFADIYRQKFGLPIYQVRAFNHTGVGQADTFVIPGWCKQAAAIAKSGKRGSMKVGNLDVSRDFCNVRDVVKAYRLVIESEDCETIYNVGSGQAVLLRDVLSYIIGLSETEIAVETDSALFRPSDNEMICCDNSRIKARLGWKSEYSIWDTVDELFRYYKG